jgi:PAS domain S-box-containing protein
MQHKKNQKSQSKSISGQKAQHTSPIDASLYKTLFDSIDEGFCILEMLFDQQNNPVDYRFLETNSVFEVQTGLKDAVGKTARELVPNLEDHWFTIYGNVALTGEPIRFENHSEAMGRWFNVYATRIGGKTSRKVALLFSDITEQKKIAEELNESELRFRNLADTAPMFIAMADETGNAVYFNKPWLTFTGKKLEEMLGFGWLTTLHPDDAEKFERDFKHAFEKQIPISEEYRFRRADGEYRWMLAVGAPRFTPEGRFIGFFGTYTDFNELKEAQLAAAKSEERFRTLIENSTDAIQLVNAEGKILYTSESIKNVLGFTPSELEGAGVIPFLHPDDRDYFIKNLTSLVKKPGGHITLQYRVKHKDGSWAWLEVTGVNHLETPHINALVGTFRNITERKKAEEELEEIRIRYQRLFDANIIGIVIAGFRGKMIGRFLDANDSFLHTFGYTKEELQTGKVRWDEITPQECQPLDLKAIKELETLGECEPYEKEYIAKSGKRIPIYVGIAAIPGTDYCIAYILDISEQKRLERQKDDFIGIASHELKTPVTSLKAYAQVLQGRLLRDGNIDAAEQLKKMDGQLNKLNGLIGDLLDVTKIESGKLQFRSEYFDFNELVTEVVDEMQRTTEKHTLIQELDTTKTVHGDRDRVGQVITNFLSNAIKYSPQAKKIIIKSKSEKHSITLSVQDFGIGIPKEKKDRVFERFYRVEDGKNHETYGGIGLGLFISSEIIRRQGGEIAVESTQGKGSTFSFTLPINGKK